MKKIITTSVLAILVLIGSSAFIIKNSTGITGYAGSPGEGTCTSCHGGGSSASSGITITAVPAFSVNGNAETEYLPDSVYQITVEAEATSFSKFGFASQILNGSNTNAGVLSNPGTGVKFLNAGSRRSAVHTTPKSSAGVASFTYKWTAPSAGGDATIYAIANAVNGNGSTNGDFVLSPVSLALVAGTPPAPTNTTSLKENTGGISQVSVFPNPASDLTNISYYLKQSKTITVALIDIQGNVVRQLYKQEETPGFHSQILNLQGVASGVYFIRTSADQYKVSQKLITVH